MYQATQSGYAGSDTKLGSVEHCCLCSRGPVGRGRPPRGPAVEGPPAGGARGGEAPADWPRGGAAGGGARRGARKWGGSLERLYKAPTDFTKPQKDNIKPRQTIQSPETLYKGQKH